MIIRGGRGHRREQRLGLVVTLEVLEPGLAVGDDAGSGLDRRPTVAVHDHRADGDGGVDVAREVDVADDTGVRPSLTGSSSSMISIARTFGAPETVPAGRVALNTSIGSALSANVPTPAR